MIQEWELLTKICLYNTMFCLTSVATKLFKNQLCDSALFSYQRKAVVKKNVSSTYFRPLGCTSLLNAVVQNPLRKPCYVHHQHSMISKLLVQISLGNSCCHDSNVSIQNENKKNSPCLNWLLLNSLAINYYNNYRILIRQSEDNH